jgi:uncharacterized protein (DUF362 family)
VIARGRGVVDERTGLVDGAAIESLLRDALGSLGGMGRFVRPGSSVLVKPNIAFAADPRGGAIADPAMIAAVVKEARAAGAREVLVTDNPIAAPGLAFDRTGIRRAVEAAGGTIVVPYERGFRLVRVPDAVVLPDWPVFFDLFERVDAVIGIAPVKSHNLSTASLTMKNWYGLLGGQRSQFHQHIHELINDLWRLIRPTSPLLILDGTRVLMRNGPTGGGAGDVAIRNTIAVGTDPVALDAFGVTLLDRNPSTVPYLVQAEAAGFGTTDFTRRGKEI